MFLKQFSIQFQETCQAQIQRLEKKPILVSRVAKAAIR